VHDDAQILLDLGQLPGLVFPVLLAVRLVRSPADRFQAVTVGRENSSVREFHEWKAKGRKRVVAKRNKTYDSVGGVAYAGKNLGSTLWHSACK
jgi:hypothetical protein